MDEDNHISSEVLSLLCYEDIALEAEQLKCKSWTRQDYNIKEV